MFITCVFFARVASCEKVKVHECKLYGVMLYAA